MDRCAKCGIKKPDVTMDIWTKLRAIKITRGCEGYKLETWCLQCIIEDQIEDILSKDVGDGRDMSNRARAMRMGLPSEGHDNLIPYLWDVQDGTCLYCNKPLNGEFHLDHIVPIKCAHQNNPGHVIDNLALACSFCNGSKQNKLLDEWLQYNRKDDIGAILHRVNQHIEIMQNERRQHDHHPNHLS